MAFPIDPSGSDLQAFLQENYAKKLRVSSRALRDYLNQGHVLENLAALDWSGATDPAALCQACAPAMGLICAQAPAEGWLSRCYDYLADGLFPDRDFIRPRLGERKALELFLSILEYCIKGEAGRLPHSLLRDPCPVTQAELAASRVQEEYRRFMEHTAQSRYLLLLRIAPCALPYDPEKHILGVHNVAVAMGRQAVQCGLPADIPLIAAASLAHDIGKFGCRGPDAARVPTLHYYYTWEWLSKLDMPQIAHVAANHSTWDLEFENLPLESLLLIYADFRVRGHRLENGTEQVSIYTLKQAHDIIYTKLSHLTEEKRRHYETVFQKLWDFQEFLQSQGVNPDPAGTPIPVQAPDPALLTPSQAVDRLRSMAFFHNVQLLHTLSGQNSMEQLLEQARSEKDPYRLRTYLRLLEDYSVYMTREGKLVALGFLYELLMHHAGDVRRHSAAIMGQILAGSGPRYRKELPSRAPKGAAAPSVTQLLQEAADLWETYILRCLYPDARISPKHALRIANSLKAIASSLFAACEPQAAPHFLAPLLRRFFAWDGLPAHRFALLDALALCPLSLLTPKEVSKVFQVLCALVQEPGQTLPLLLASLRLAIGILQAGCPGGKQGVAALLQALPRQEEPAIAYLVAQLEAGLGRLPGPAGFDVSQLYLANLKKAVHWTVKLTYVDMLAGYAKAHGEEAFHIATHLSNLLSVSEHLPVRERAGQALVELAPMLRADQRNEIVIDLIRELESGQDPIGQYIPPFLGKLICGLPPKEMAECTDLLEAMVRSSQIRPARFALSTLGVMLGQVCDQPLAVRILGLLLTGVAHYENSIHRTALYVLCKGFLGQTSIPLARRQQVFLRCGKKLLTLLCEPRAGKTTFFNRAAMLNHLYRFITQAQVELGPWRFPAPGPAAFFPGTFDPFSAGHRRIVEEILALGYTVYLAVDEFSWRKRTLPKLLRRQIAMLSTADAPNVYLFPDDIPINIAMPQDLAKLSSLFPGEGVSLVMGSDVVQNASAYRHNQPGGAQEYDHIVFTRAEGQEPGAVEQAIRRRIQRQLRLLALPPDYETVSSTRIRESIDKNMDISMLVDPVVQDFIYAKGLYLRTPQDKRLLQQDALYFSESRPQQGAYICQLHRRDAQEPLGWVQAQSLSVSQLYTVLNSAPEAEALRQQVSGKVLLLETCQAPGPEEARLLCNQLLARCLLDDVTFAIYRADSPQDPLAQLLPQLGFVPLGPCPQLYLVDMRAPMILIQDVLCRLKAPFSSEPSVIKAVKERRPSLRLDLCGLFPGRLLLCFDTELLNQALMEKVQRWNPVAPGHNGMGANMCVPYGKVLSGDMVPHTVTKALHAEKVFAPDLRSFSILESPGYSSLANQARTLKSFQRPVLLVDDLLHNGYRLEKLEPIFRAEGVPIARIIVGVLSGRGMDLTKAQGWPVDWEYFIPNLRYWFNESLLYPFIGGDGMGGAPPRGSVIPSVNLMLPYAYPRFLRDAPEQAVLQLCRTALCNAKDILQVLEARHLAILTSPLTIRRLGDVFIASRPPHRGDALRYDPNALPSQCLREDVAALDRLARPLPTSP